MYLYLVGNYWWIKKSCFCKNFSIHSHSWYFTHLFYFWSWTKYWLLFVLPPVTLSHVLLSFIFVVGVARCRRRVTWRHGPWWTVQGVCARKVTVLWGESICVATVKVLHFCLCDSTIKRVPVGRSFTTVVTLLGSGLMIRVWGVFDVHEKKNSSISTWECFLHVYSLFK